MKGQGKIWKIGHDFRNFAGILRESFNLYFLIYMKKILFLMIAAMAVMQVSAANVDRVTAQNKAAQFLKSQVSSGKLMSSQNVRFVSERTIYNSANVTVPVYYIFNTEDRFVIVSGEDRGESILAVGDGTLDLDNIPANMQGWLEGYQHQIEYLQAHPGMVVKTMSQSFKAPNRAQNVSPLLTARWDQTRPFWNDCVFNNVQCLTGCPATSLAQVFYYWKYPTAPTPSLSGYSSSGYTIPALPSTTFDWANMRDYYGWSGNTGTAEQKAAVAKLMRYIGQAEHMDYGPNGSGISSSRTDLISTACKTFGYDNNVRAIYKQTYYGGNIYTDSQWASMIQAELASGHPIVYCGLSNNGGHAFNVDGYTVSSNLYHINWGWSGSGNGDFALNAFTDYGGDTYNQYQSMVIGIQPPGGEITFPVLNVSPESLDFGVINSGQTVTKTITVTGINLMGDITITSKSPMYQVSPATLTAEQVEAGATVQVTYAPTNSGAHTSKIVVSGGAAETKEVTVTGATSSTPVVTVDPEELDFTTEINEPTTADFMLKGYNLPGAVKLYVVNSTGGFSINKSNVTKAAANKGAIVTVTYKPTTAGNHTAQVMAVVTGGDTVYVQLNGTAYIIKTNPVMLPADSAHITTSSFLAEWTDGSSHGGVSSYTLEYATGSDTRTVTGIQNRNYLLENLTAGAMYTYKVKALYIDGTESLWSNTEQVTLLSGSTYEVGDVNTDGSINIADVTALIDYLLGSGEVDLNCADVNGDSSINIADVTALIDKLLSGN